MTWYRIKVKFLGLGGTTISYKTIIPSNSPAEAVKDVEDSVRSLYQFKLFLLNREIKEVSK